jgi:salicylate 5-hydroxylase small subunit
VTTAVAVPYEVRVRIEDLYARYASAIDDDELERWPALFCEDGSYRIVARENLERGLPLATMSCDSRAAMEDRVFAIRSANFYLPRTVRHLIGHLAITALDEAAWHVEASYAVYETIRRRPTTVLSVGRYDDRVVAVDDELRFAAKCCVYDSELVPNSIVFPL